MKKKFNELTGEDIEYIRSVHKSKDLTWAEKMGKLTKFTGLAERQTRIWIGKLGLTSGKKDGIMKSEQFEAAKTKEHQTKQYYLITWAQNNTDIHKEMLKNMEAYAKFLDAEILVIAGRYRNPTSLDQSHYLQEKERIRKVLWPTQLDKYLTANRHNIHKYLQILSDVKTQPTAATPLSGFEGFSGLESSILGHPKQHLKSLPILEGYPHKVLVSTGSITKANYTDTKAGKKGEFDHVYGFIVVEINDEDTFYLRNVNVSDSGEFNDLFFNVKNGAVTENKSMEAAILGDSHSGSEDQVIVNKSLDLFKILKPKKVVKHDVFDAYSISHHHEKDPFLKYEKSQNGKDDLKLELDNMYSYLSNFESYYETVIVRANHDDHLDQWLRRQDWKRDCKNALLYMELATLVLKGETPKGVIPYLVKENFPEFTCLGVNDSYLIKGIECGLHGDKGSNGARGSGTTFRKLNVKTVTGHTHTPEIIGGAYIVGTSTHLRLEYNDGLSSWMNAHCIIDKLGKRQLLLFINGEYTTLYKKLKKAS